MVDQHAPPQALKAPISDSKLLTTREKIILLRGSKLHGCIFPPWEASPSMPELGQEFQDDTDFNLPELQRQDLDGWRIADVDEPLLGPGSSGEKLDLVQDVTTDCSVVASLCVESARTERLDKPGSSLMSAAMFPPTQRSPGGKHVFKFYFNGAFRKVIIDDRLPAAKSERVLHVFDRSKPRLAWPALCEKAYMKVRGGYDLPGSNSGTDLLVLTGWIPEQLFLESDEIIPRALWKRIYNAFNYGDVLITLGTGKLSEHEESGLGLTGEHAYAVIDMREVGERCLFLVKNPWSKGQEWTGSTQSMSDASTGNSSEALPVAPNPPGVFWMDMNNLLQLFQSMYLSWNPGLFTHRRDVHFTWTPQSECRGGYFGDNPQYLIRSKVGGTVWLLLSMHFSSRTELEEGQTNGAQQRTQNGHLSIYLFERDTRIIVKKGQVRRSPYVDSPNALLRCELPSNVPHVVLISEQGMPRKSANFTLSALSRGPFLDFAPARDRLIHRVAVQGVWAAHTSGGNKNSPRYDVNPQYRLNVPVVTDIAIVLETSDDDDDEIAVHVALIWAGGQRFSSRLSARDVLGDSGEYRPGCALIELGNVPAGSYTAICSTFRKGQIGKFSLVARSSDCECELKAIPPEEAGKLTTRLPELFLSSGEDRILAPITTARITQLRASLRCQPMRGLAQTSQSLFRLSIEYGQGPNKRTMASTGEFMDAPSGLKTPEVDIRPAMCAADGPGVWLVVERTGAAGEASSDEARVEISASEPGVAFGAWVRESDEAEDTSERRMRGLAVR